MHYAVVRQCAKLYNTMYYHAMKSDAIKREFLGRNEARYRGPPRAPKGTFQAKTVFTRRRVGVDGAGGTKLPFRCNSLR